MTKKQEPSDKEKRLAEALRANLRRRKQAKKPSEPKNRKDA